jgi:hypothetical protein
MRMKPANFKVNLLLKISLLMFCISVSACKKVASAEEAKINPPVRSYVITARIDKKGTNTISEGVGILKGTYDEQTKILVYNLEYEKIVPILITLRSGAKGTAGILIKELYKDGAAAAISGSISLSPLQERNLLKGLWFVSMNSTTASPDISGSLTLKQK